MKKIFFGILIFIGLFLHARILYAGWEFAGWYGGGCFPNAEFDPNEPNRVYLVSDVAGIWRSDDVGDHWKFINKGITNLNVAQLAVAPSNSSMLYAGTTGGLFFSTDSGEQWQAASSFGKRIKFVRPASTRAIAVDPKDPEHVCVGSANGGVFCSQNHGQDWTDLDPGKVFWKDKQLISALTFSPTDNSLYAAGNPGMGRYDFLAQKWEWFENSPKGISDFIFSVKSPTTLYVAGHEVLWISEDGGVSWISNNSIPTGKIYRLALSSGAEEGVFVGWKENYNGGICLTSDQGKEWVPLGKTFVPDRNADPSRDWSVSKRRMTSLKVNPFNSKQLILTDWWGVWRSEDGGISWQEKILGAPNTVGSDITFSPDGKLLVATMDNGLLISRDSGKNYQCLFPTKGYSKDKNGHVWRVLSLDQDRIIATSSPWDDKLNQVIISEDGGENFSIIREGLPSSRPKGNTMWGEGYARALAVDPQNHDIVYLGMDGDKGGGLFVSLDAGKTWGRSEGQPASLRIYNGLAVDPLDSDRIFWGACGKGGGVYRSQDRGKTFKLVFAEVSWVFDLATDSKGTIFAAGDKGGAVLYISKNHGESWKLLKKFSDKGTAEAITIDPKNSQRIAVSTVKWSNSAPGAVFLTVNGGKTWKDISEDLPPGSGAAAMTFSPEGNYLFISRYAGSVYKFQLEDVPNKKSK